MTSVAPINNLRIYALEAKMELLKTLRIPVYTISSLAFPLMFYVFFGILFNPSNGDASMAAYFMITYGTFGIMGPALFSFGAGLASDKDQGWLDLKQLSPMPVLAFVVARIVTAICFSLLIIISLFILAASLGDVSLPLMDWLSIALILLLGILPFCGLGMWLGLSVKAQAAPAVVNLIFLPMAFFSGLWVPIHLFPDWMQAFAQLSPAYHLVQIVFKVLSYDQGQPLLLHSLVLVVYTVTFVFLATKAYRNLSEKT